MNYQVTTSVATIGIRGTEYTIQYGQSIAGTVGEGQIDVCNGAGCLSVTNGESYYVQNDAIKPVLTNKHTDLPPPPPENPPTEFVEGDTSAKPAKIARLTRRRARRPHFPAYSLARLTEVSLSRTHPHQWGGKSSRHQHLVHGKRDSRLQRQAGING